jgi:hypothetical protein
MLQVTDNELFSRVPCYHSFSWFRPAENTGNQLQERGFSFSGRREPRIGYLLNLMDLTGVTGEWLLSGKGDMYGKEEKIISKEEAIEALYGDKADELIL